MSASWPDRANRRVMALLAAGVPLSLLLDLAGGPDSAEIGATERGEVGWLRLRDGRPAPGSAA